MVVVNAMLVAVPLQIVWEAGVATTFGNGFTVMITLSGVPLQPPADGVIK